MGETPQRNNISGYDLALGVYGLNETGQPTGITANHTTHTDTYILMLTMAQNRLSVRA